MKIQHKITIGRQAFLDLLVDAGVKVAHSSTVRVRHDGGNVIIDEEENGGDVIAVEWTEDVGYVTP